MESQSISQHQKSTTECQDYRIAFGIGYLASRLWSFFQAQRFSFMDALTMKKIQPPAFVGRVQVAGLASMKALALSSTVNLRVYLGVLVMAASPAAACTHMLFDRDDVIVGWYHRSLFDLFMLWGPWLFALMVVLSFFLLLPEKHKTFKLYKWSLKAQLTRLACYPLAFIIGKIIWLYRTTENADYWSIPNFSYLAVGLLFAYVMVRTIDYFIWKAFHAMDGLLCSLEGLHKIDLPADVLREKAAPIISELKQFHSKY